MKKIMIILIFIFGIPIIYVSVVEPLNCQNFNSEAWKSGNQKQRYPLACKNLCETIQGKTEEEALNLLGEPDNGRHQGQHWRYQTKGTLSFVDILHVKIENHQVIECFLSAESKY